MAYNLSSNQQYLLSLVQQNNPEILSKFLNEAKEDALGAYRMMKDKIVDDNGKVTYKDPEQQDAYDKAEARRNAPSSKYTGKVTPGMGYIPGENVIIDGDAVPSTQNKVALRYAKKAKENELPLGERPISPFYKTTRNQFRAEFGRDFDASGGATPANMRGLVNIKTDLAGRLNDIETGWQDKMAWEAQLKAGEPFTKRIAPNSKEFYQQEKQRMDATWKAKGRAENQNPVHNYRARDFDVPGMVKPGEKRDDSRTLPSKPVDTMRTSEWIDRGAHDNLRTMWNDPTQREMMRQQGFNPESMLNTPVEGGGEMRIDWTKGPGCQGPFCQASNLSGKSVNQKISRIA
jgi:hypothetical protein